ncbi:uncharacterized protein Z519_04487 [Cladophialophora bantiana CBS 173.52]|uniref:Major facilitator superfamily (MFS) profile domain-containing protein n=1 Tax=Cladophialophora bantiana (strain ATCC 10958 / CBS 173.52 / CDC B-1940 / NIH 8579) TaxID=1442370 RepID=A0A0D2EXA2_CLAB1|nr:uncharacterized protein Z519_04487 [Cladophialophora bantiana CBS 173.52]KIW94511.1 hypothetical protein Z519_04487 [Cladophialophora bantiana CBS 173.52]
MQNQELEEPRRDWVAPTERDISFQGLSSEHESLLKEALDPEDAYKGRTYWADLPAGERTKWVNDQHTSESRRELRDVWDMFEADPLDPINQYLHNYAVTGVGFFTEGYVLFSVGNILPLLEVAITYMEILGIICGQILVGIIGDWIGRRWGLIQDALIMLTGTILLTSMWGITLSSWTVMYGISLFWFSVGVGGEYPMTSSTAMEGIHGRATSRHDRLHRGRSVALAFLMQGWGQFGNQLVLILVMLIFNHSLNPGYGKTAAQVTFRISFGIAALCLLYFLYLRVYKLKGVGQSLKASRKKGKVTGYDVTSLKLTTNHYWHRLLATSLCWFCNDFPFHGNQIFQNVFLQIVTSSPSQVGTLWLYNLINIGCELAGYYLAALFKDHKSYGRKRMQAVGFIMSFILFIIAARLYPELDVKGAGGKALELIYFFSSFWIQFGPNFTTFLEAGEVVGWFGLIGFILTLLFIPDTTGLDLREQEQSRHFMREGRPQDYHGIAIHPRHYNLELGRLARINELTELYEKVEGSKSAETDEETLPETNQADLDDSVSRYFDMERRHGKKQDW